MNISSEDINLTYQKYGTLYKNMMDKFKEDVSDLPLFKKLEKGKYYIVSYKEYNSRDEKKCMYIKYEGVKLNGSLMEYAQIKYMPVKKDLSEYQGRRGYTQSISISKIISMKKIEEKN